VNHYLFVRRLKRAPVMIIPNLSFLCTFQMIKKWRGNMTPQELTSP
jgi:hypothetical protein